MSSDTDTDIAEEDVTVVKISRRRAKGGSGSSRHSRRWHNSTTTINAPPGSIVEVDLTQESDHQGLMKIFITYSRTSQDMDGALHTDFANFYTI